MGLMQGEKFEALLELAMGEGVSTLSVDTDLQGMAVKLPENSASLPIASRPVDLIYSFSMTFRVCVGFTRTLRAGCIWGTKSYVALLG